MNRLLATALAATMTFLAACSDRPAPTVPEPFGTATPAPSPTATPVGGERPDPALVQPGQLFREGRFEAAAEAYRAVAENAKDPASRSAALLGLGISLYEDGDIAGSTEALRTAVNDAPEGATSGRRAAYLLSVRLVASDRFGEAAEVIRPFAASGPADALQPYLLLQFAKASRLAGAGVAAGAAPIRLLEDPAIPPALTVDAYRERAALAKAAGDTAAAREALTMAAELAGDAETRYEVALLARDAGEMETFAAQLALIVSKNPTSREAVLAIADLKDAGYVVDAGEEGIVYYRRRALVEARTTLLAAIEEPGLDESTLALRLYYLAAAYEDAGNPGPAVGYYDRAAMADPAGPLAHRARYWAARSMESLGEFESASARYAEIAEHPVTGDFTKESRFRAGYTLLKGGDPAGAVAMWDRLEVAGDGRALYWKARAHEALGDTAAAAVAYQAAAEQEPLSFYGSEASRHGANATVDVGYRALAPFAPIDWDAIAAWMTGNRGGAFEPAPPNIAADLLAMGLRREAVRELDRAAAGASEWTTLAIIRQAHELGLSDVSARLATRILPPDTTAGKAPKDLVRLAYPLDYVTLLDEAARKSDIDPLLLAALVRQESFWDPLAGSSAGALGLTQVIPSTGQGIANALGAAWYTTDDLFRPAVSLEFGAYYLGGQIRRFGDPHPALAAYNAGPGRAVNWVAAAKSGRAPDFVEAIDIPETQEYVEKIMNHYALYLYAWGE